MTAKETDLTIISEQRFMSFSSHVEEGESSVITLLDKTNNTRAEIYSFGALLNGFTMNTSHGDKNIIDGYASPADARENITRSFKSAKLSPFVCRLRDGAYSFGDQPYKIQKFYLGTEAIHGLLFNLPFTIAGLGSDSKGAYVQLECAYSNINEGFPFPFSMQVTYTLSAHNMLSLQTRVTNTGTTSMPLNDGWHPYFTLGPSVNDLAVQFNSHTMLEFDNRLLPTGNFLRYEKFETLNAFGDTALDNCFLLRDFTAPSCILRDENTRLQLTIRADPSYPYLQVYTPPHRKSIAIENLSSAPDSFNNHMGLVIVKPGEQITFATSYQMQSL